MKTLLSLCVALVGIAAFAPTGASAETVVVEHHRHHVYHHHYRHHHHVTVVHEG